MRMLLAGAEGVVPRIFGDCVLAAFDAGLINSGSDKDEGDGMHAMQKGKLDN